MLDKRGKIRAALVSSDLALTVWLHDETVNDYQVSSVLYGGGWGARNRKQNTDLYS